MFRAIVRKGIRWIRYKIGFGKSRGQIRKDVTVIPVQPNLDLIVYWKVLDIGKGPAAVLKVHETEVLKFDCFGMEKGHFHVAPNYGKRIFFQDNTAIEQIERTVQELNVNAQYYLNQLEQAHIRSITIEVEKLKDSTEIAKRKMIEFLNTVPALEDLK